MKCEPCSICQMLREVYPSDPHLHCNYNIKCIFCGARLVQKMQRTYVKPRSEISAKCAAVLADWKAYGHDEAEFRKLAKATPWAVQQP